MPLTELPKGLAKFAPLLQEYHKALADQHISPQAAALNFVKNIPEIDNMIIGVNNAAQLEQNITAYNAQGAEGLKKFACKDLLLIDPSNWSK